MRTQLGTVALILGILMVLLGFSTGNGGEIFLGLIVLGIGIFDRIKHKRKDSGSA